MYSILGSIDWSALTTGLTTNFESAVTSVLPVLAVIVGAVLTVKTVRKFIRA